MSIDITKKYREISLYFWRVIIVHLNDTSGAGTRADLLQRIRAEARCFFLIVFPLDLQTGPPGGEGTQAAGPGEEL